MWLIEKPWDFDNRPEDGEPLDFISAEDVCLECCGTGVQLHQFPDDYRTCRHCGGTGAEPNLEERPCGTL